LECGIEDSIDALCVSQGCLAAAAAAAATLVQLLTARTHRNARAALLQAWALS